MRLSDKIAVVTGAGGGIGRAAAVRFAREGAMVFAVDINVDGNRETAELSDAIEPLTVDVSDGQSVSAMVQTVLDRHGRLDVFFSNAGIMRDGNVIDLEEDDWDAMPPEKRQHFLSNINKSSERLLDLVNDLSKISTARNLKPDETARANVNDVLTSILSLNSSHQLQIETNKDVSDVNMEPELLNSIVTSIIENAKRHGGDDVNIKVTSKFNDTNKTVQLQVSNDGKSIPEDISDRIFEPFFSTVRDYTRKSGSGLQSNCCHFGDAPPVLVGLALAALRQTIRG